jgi:ribonuclease MRP protein subunit RMP1
LSNSELVRISHRKPLCYCLACFSTMVKKQLSKLPPQHELELLNKVLLHLHHRNKNQHRRSHWWKHLNTFRRQLRAITVEILSEPEGALASSDPSPPGLVKLNVKGQQRLQAWIAFYVVKWYEAFAQILTERRFVGIGLVLLATLAKASAILGATEGLRLRGQQDLVDAMKNMEKSQTELLEEAVTDARQDEDVGEVIEREKVFEDSFPHQVAADFLLSPLDAATETKSNKKAKRRKKNANAIDDLFDGL